jgi:hypothetical protein
MRSFADRFGFERPTGFGVLAVVILVSLPTSVWLVTSQLFHTNIFYFGQYGLARHLDGTVYRPFAYRILTDWVVRLVVAAHLPRIAVTHLDSVVMIACQTQHEVPAASCEQVKAYAMVATACAWGFLVSTYFAALRVFRSPLWAAMTTGLAALTVNALLLQGYGQPYDFSTLLFATLLFLAAESQRNSVFAVLLVAGCLVKESLFLFVPVYALIAYKKKPLWHIASNAIVQCAIFLAVYGWERLRFQHNPGAPMYHNISGHLRYLSDKATITAILALIFTGILLFYRLPDKPIALQRSMWILPVLLLLYVVGGNPGEFRIVFDVFPIILLPIADTLRRLVTADQPIA